MDAVLEDLRAFLSNQIQEGFDAVHDIVKNATQYAEETHGRSDLQPEIRRLTAELLVAHHSDQAKWATPTDCDRLDEAFANLNGAGIVARQNFSCCNNCGFAEIWDEIEIEEKTHVVEGYVFYHLQCTETAIKSGRLMMAYGSVEENPESLHRVANKIVDELRRAGLNASWGGTDRHPIAVDNFVWRRRI